MKKFLGLVFMAVVAMSVSSCCCDKDPCCEPPRPRCCEPRPCCKPAPVCPPRACEPRYVDNNCYYN